MHRTRHEEHGSKTVKTHKFSTLVWHRLAGCRRLFAFLLLLSALKSGLAQDFSLFANWAAFDSTLLPLCGQTNGFSARVVIEMFDRSGQPKGVLPYNWSVRDGFSRLEILMLESDAVPVEAREGLRTLGVETLVILPRPNQKLTCVVQPYLRAVCEVPMGPAAIANLARQQKMRPVFSAVGEERVGDYVCEKVKVVDPSYTNEVAMVWRARKFSGFPVQIYIATPQGFQKIKFSNISLKNPAPDLFDVPTNFVKLPDGKAFIPLAVERQTRSLNQQKQ